MIVNCTAVGMEGAGDPFAELPIERAKLEESVILVDLVYGGEETALIAEGRDRGARVVEGLEVLVRQGASRSASGRGSSPHWT